MKRILLTTATLFACLYFFVAIGYAQEEEFRFEYLTDQQGLSQNTVKCIEQDSEGFMWFGTLDGLNKYDGYNFTVFRPDPDDPEHTLNHSYISDIHEDKTGRLWVTTYGGGFHQVDKFTGEVKHFDIEPVGINKWNYIWSIHESQDGILWLSAVGGIVRFDPSTGQFTPYVPPGKMLWFKSITEDNSQRLWTSGENGIYQLDKETGKFTPMVLDASLDRQPNCNSVYIDEEGILWAGSYEEGLFRMDTNKKPFYFTRYNPGGQIKKQHPFIYGVEPDYLWVCGSEGLYRINKQTDQVLTIEANPEKPGSLSHKQTNAVYKTRSGTFWVCTVNGINKVAAHPKRFQTQQIVPTSLSVILDKNTIGSLVEDNEGNIWLGTGGDSFFYFNSFEGLYQFDSNTNSIIHYPADPTDPGSLATNQVWSLHLDKKNRLWVGTVEALYMRDRSTGKFTRYPTDIPVEQIVEDPNGKIWIGKGNCFVYPIISPIASFDPNTKSFTYYDYDSRMANSLLYLSVYDILASQNGDIWMGFSGGLARLDQQTNTFTTYLPNYTVNTEDTINATVYQKGHNRLEPNTQASISNIVQLTSSQKFLNYKIVHALYEDPEGIIWAGTKQGGLNRLDPKTNTFTNFTMKDGLPSNHIVSIIGDEGGNLWLGTTNGISRFNPKTKEFRNFDVNDGLPANEFRVGSVYASDGKLMFGSINGFVIFDPDSIQDNTTVPPVYITGFQMMDEDREVPAGSIELAYDENFLSFDFVALNYDAPEKNQYAYMLEGVDKDWVYSDTRRFASYTDLDPGEYTFRVKASNNDGIWNEEGATIVVTILPPWWQTGWAYALYTVLGLSLLYSLRQYTVKRERLRHELNIQRMEAEKMHEVDQLKSRFFANISHEFRTPLTLLLGPLDKLMTEPAYAKEHSLFSMMQRNAQRLLHLINQLLDLSKLEAGRMQAEVKAGAIVPFLQSIGLSFTTLAERQQISYHFQYPNDRPVVYFDADKLEKIITNLLSNAFKFTPAGGSITFSARLHAAEKSITTPVQKPQDAAQLSLLELKVQDSGVGMSEEQLAHVFHRFYQADDSQQASEGSGIGLSLVRELVELHGGEVSASSEAEKGSCFTVKLPLWQTEFAEIVVGQEGNGKEQVLPPAASGYQTNGSPISESHSEAPLILVVEDNADVRAFIRENLQAVYRVMEAANGMAAYQQAIEHIPDLILSDVMMPTVEMPKMDGVELCQKLKTNEKTAHIPVILLTAKASGGDKIEGLETGADDYIIKPFKADELLVRIKNLIESRRKLREQFSREITLQPSSVKVSSADEQFLQRLLAIMEAHMADFTFGVESMGKELGMSRVQLYRKLKALTNQAPGDFIRMMRLKRAADLLSRDSGSIAEVAYAVGFNDPFYFSKSFHKQYGQTPSEYAAAVVS
ncbi:signal transduction histidine kinase/ligand-binding sensor domain-containing protein/DNA-binding response OmpR family regulator [Catalinimonas alkaloidigena]|uniref:hybrid sensor histidine kinase/response regulator transcription factor n=1 Tax=Catalinimonas alkaloidigena TaxID=1075417 RepID=UPI002406BA0E|nr:two-component regulator propeller domain-containing protein [Catalinimonas alkaloidigena]MDF9795450.1 signal transduction histidine kinase/ligand-binding sensor domain-containing protein/DNA-binding response OmpR family regulator [Catalinimonas alkaloidigena]